MSEESKIDKELRRNPLMGTSKVPVAGGCNGYSRSIVGSLVGFLYSGRAIPLSKEKRDAGT